MTRCGIHGAADAQLEWVFKNGAYSLRSGPSILSVVTRRIKVDVCELNSLPFEVATTEDAKAWTVLNRAVDSY